MTLKVWKYQIGINGVTSLNMPKHAELLHFAEQNEIATMWVLVDPDGGDGWEDREFRIYGTGENFVNAPLHYFVGTALFSTGRVWHLFEVRGEPRI